MYQSVIFYRSGWNGNFRYKYLENHTVYFVENYMIVKLKYCIITFYIFFFFLDNQLSFQFRIFHFQVSCETAFSTIRKYGIGLQVFLVISKANIEFLNPLYRKTLLVRTSIRAHTFFYFTPIFPPVIVQKRRVNQIVLLFAF